MFKRAQLLYIATLLLAFIIPACKGTADDEATSIDYSSTQIKTFSLKADTKVLNNLDSVFFSIDLVNARIFNADSLPYGTKVNKLLVNITTDNCSVVELHFPREGKNDSIVNFLTNAKDSIDFSRGAVKLHVVSNDHTASRDYYINVNVHKTVGDSLTWDVKNPSPLPGSLATPVKAATVQMAGAFYTLTTDGNRHACINVASSPLDRGINTEFDFTFTPDVNSLVANSQAMYILSTDGDLHSSIDGKSWTSLGVKWKAITAPYGKTILGLAEVDGKLSHVTWPSSTSTAVNDNDFPLTGASQPLLFSTKWSDRDQIIIVGGSRADGSTTSAAWAYDGTNWAKIAEKTPMNASGMTVFPYYFCSTDTNKWIATKRSVIVAMGGRRLEQGKDVVMMGDVYLSYDFGFHWTKAPKSMTLPTTFPAVSDTRVFVVNETLHSRAVRPITEWDTPYIYMYGGYNRQGSLSTNIYRGVFNVLQFKPLQ